MEFEMNEIWNIYREDIVPIDKYEVISVSQNCEGTKVVLGGNKNSMEILFGAVDTLLAEWIEKESAGIYTDSTHYVIMTINDIVDIVAPFPPEITIKPISD